MFIHLIFLDLKLYRQVPIYYVYQVIPITNRPPLNIIYVDIFVVRHTSKTLTNRMLEDFALLLKSSITLTEHFDHTCGVFAIIAEKKKNVEKIKTVRPRPYHVVVWCIQCNQVHSIVFLIKCDKLRHKPVHTDIVLVIFKYLFTHRKRLVSYYKRVYFFTHTLTLFTLYTHTRVHYTHIIIYSDNIRLKYIQSGN